MSLLAALALFVIVTYGFRALGLVAPTVVGRIEHWAEPLIAAALASLVVSGTFAAQQTLSIDARAVGLMVAVVAAALRAPLLVTLLAAVAATTVVRLVS